VIEAQMKKRNLENYELFYMELPQTDYFDDIEIQDEYDVNSYDKIQGLSDEQVSEIARDSLNTTATNSSDSPSDLKLFTDDQSQSK
jgi:hypothetical protein